MPSKTACLDGEDGFCRGAGGLEKGRKRARRWDSENGSEKRSVPRIDLLLVDLVSSFNKPI